MTFVKQDTKDADIVGWLHDHPEMGEAHSCIRGSGVQCQMFGGLKMWPLESFAWL